MIKSIENIVQKSWVARMVAHSSVEFLATAESAQAITPGVPGVGEALCEMSAAKQAGRARRRDFCSN
jgi:hypothetical protein